jgi:hypothetical protein
MDPEHQRYEKRSVWVSFSFVFALDSPQKFWGSWLVTGEAIYAFSDGYLIFVFPFLFNTVWSVIVVEFGFGYESESENENEIWKIGK